MRTFAIVLLLWTAIDLVNTGICSADAVQASATAMRAVQAGPTSGDSSLPAYDDCFCCSHTVTVPSVVAGAQPRRVLGRNYAAAEAPPLLLAHSLDRPPQDVR